MKTNTDWSAHVQGVMTLYLSRKLRFDDRFFGQYQKVFGLDAAAPLRMLEVGCGPGALCEALRRRYPNAEIYGVDRDSAFLSFAKKTVKGVDFIEGDAMQLPFADGSFDVTISNTVQEHVEPTAFWGEQLRALRPGGVCICLSARKGLRCVAPCLAPTEEEKAFWANAPQAEAEFEKYGVCRYPLTEAGLAAAMERHGFVNVTTGYAIADLTPDDPKYPADLARAMIEADRQCDLEAARSFAPGGADDVCRIINARYDERLRLYSEGKKQWDTAVCVTMILRGEKPKT